MHQSDGKMAKKKVGLEFHSFGQLAYKVLIGTSFIKSTIWFMLVHDAEM